MKLPPAKKKQGPSSNLEKGHFIFSNRLMYITVFMFFSSSFLCVIFGFKTIIGLFDLFKILAASVVLAIVLQHAFFQSVFPMNNAERYAFSGFGLGPSLCAAFFMLNFLIPVKSETTTHLVLESYHSSGSLYFTAEGLPCEQYPELCVKFMYGESGFEAGEYINVTIDKGVGGFHVLKNVEAVTDPAFLKPE